jgi:MFS transporter, DHA1 family, multidrug resistance protein
VSSNTDVAHAEAAPGEARQRRQLILLLAACSSLGPISSLLLMPALPAIRVDFGASTSATQTVISSFLFAFAAGVMFAGPLSDRHGRRPLILGGLLVFLVGSIGAAVAPTLPLLVAGRVVQALGCAVTMTVARAVAGDLYHDWRLAQALANITLGMMLGTTFSPYIGGLLTEAFGWHATFLLLMVAAAVIALATWRLLPETRVSVPGGASFAQLGQSSLLVLRNPRFTACVIDAGVIFAVYLVFISLAPYVMSEMLGRPATDFGKYTLLMSGGYFAGNLYVVKRGRAGNMERLARIGSVLQAVSALAALGFVLAGFTHPAFWFLPMMPMAFAQGLALPHITASAVQLAPGYAGTASSLLGFGQQAITALSVQLMGLAATDTPVPVLAFCAAMSLVSVGTLAFGSAQRK